MPSTFSPSLRIELIGEGEQDGLWGQTTNNNLGELIEQAIAGVTAVDVTAGNVTLTSFNGTVDEARNAVLNITGTPGVARNVVIPNQKKTYLVSNASDAAIGIKTSAGAAATVSAGSKSLLVCNGSDVVTTYLESAVITPPFPVGTRVLFQQTAAPTGWTKITTFNDAALRVVSGAASSGGSVGFTTAFSSQNVGATALSAAQIPSHTHTFSGTTSGIGDHVHTYTVIAAIGGSSYTGGGSGTVTANTGGAGAHDHSYSGTTSSIGSGSTHTHTLNLAVQYVDIIIAAKD
jgi:hypothetical protein